MRFNNSNYRKIYDEYMKKNDLSVNAVAKKILCFVDNYDENDVNVTDDLASIYKKYRIGSVKPRDNHRIAKIAEFFNINVELLKSDSIQTNNMEINCNVLLKEALGKALDMYFKYLAKLTVPVVEGLAQIPDSEYDVDNIDGILTDRDEMENPTEDLVNFARYICFLPKKFYGMLYTALYYFYYCENNRILYYNDLQEFYNINIKEYLEKNFHVDNDNEKECIDKFLSENVIYDFIDIIHEKFITEANNIANQIR